MDQKKERKSLTGRISEQFARDNMCEHVHHSGSIAAVRRVQSHQPLCQNNSWEAGCNRSPCPVRAGAPSPVRFIHTRRRLRSAKENGKASCVEMNPKCPAKG